MLSAILSRKRTEVETLDAPYSLDSSDEDFIGSLRSHTPALIAEIKPRSPSAGELLSRTRVADMVSVYDQHAQSISVLCDAEDFGGGYDVLEEVRGLTDLPILAKEFIIDEVQIRRARSAGADAVLLIAQALQSEEIETLAHAAMDYDMSVLLELHTEDDLEKIPSLSPDEMVLGVNNRDLETLEIDLAHTTRLVPKITDQYPDHLIVAESGIASAEDVDALQHFADGFLIGTTFLQSKDPAATIYSLFPR